MRKILTICVIGFSGILAAAGNIPAQPEPQKIDSPFQSHVWPAEWIRHVAGPRYDFGVFYFRTSFDLPTVPETFLVHVTADNRYRLFVNGVSVSTGPARGDLQHWRYDTVDIAQYLQAGENTLAAEVWNFGAHRPVYQISHETAFLLCGDGPAEALVNTGPDTGWRSWRSEAWKPLKIRARGYYVVGPGEEIDGTRVLWGWREVDFDDSGWAAVASLGEGRPTAQRGHSIWGLEPRPIPLMKEEPRRFARIRRQDNADWPDVFLAGSHPVTVPPHTTISVLIDNDVLTTSYPELALTGGRGATVTARYAEALYDGEGFKGNRNDVDGKHILGNYDIFRPDGGADRVFRPLFWRTFRYVQLDIETGDEPLTLEDYRHVFTTYPFEWSARFESDADRIQEIWDVGIRTLELCSYETFVDCPYYEQLQYIGDTRNEALTTYYLSGDDRLGKNAITLFDYSHHFSGITDSRYPHNVPQVIPGYSLEWIKMVHDFWWYRDDPEYVRSMLHGIRSVLQWFNRFRDDSELITKVDWWPYIDWSWSQGHPPFDAKGRSAIFSLSYADALQKAADLEAAFGMPELAVHYRRQAQRTINAVRQLCWDEEKGLLADTPDRDTFSQHVNIWGVLVDAVEPHRQRAVMERVIADPSLTQTSLYYQYFYHQAVRKVGLADRYVELLQPWYDMLDVGLTTWAEIIDRPDRSSRSDCHAWSSHPNFHLLATVAGIESAAPGFKRVTIRPALGSQTYIRASMPHPQGTIRVDVRRAGATGLTGSVTLPAGVSGTLYWQGAEIALQGGTREFTLP